MTTPKNAVKLPRAASFATWLFITIVIFWLLVIGKKLLIPLVLAFLAMYLIEVVANQWSRIHIGHRRMPDWCARGLALGVILLMMYGVFVVVVENAAQVARSAPRYQERITAVYESLLSRFHIEAPEAVGQIFEGIDLGSILGTVATGLGSLVGNSSLVLVYLIFILLERRFLQPKMKALTANDTQRQQIWHLFQNIDHDIRIYLGVKTFTSLTTALIAYLIMRLVGLDFPEFFALLIFLFNFIPNIGSLVATTLPTMLALLQFDTYRPFLIVGIGIASVQVVMGNLIEPPLTGNSLNISPLTVILSLVFWGMIWGIPGMFLCVPITVILMIVFSQFASTRWLAVLLSKNGTLRNN